MGSSTTLRCLVLDAMGVIFSAADDVAELLIPFVQATGGETDPRKIEAAYFDASAGQIGPDEFWVQVGLDPAVERDYLSRHSLLPGAREFLFLAKHTGLPVWCLSNDVGRWSRELRKTLGVDPLLGGAIISSDVRVRKPDRRIYECLLEQSGYRPSAMLFIDDRAKNVAAAMALGIPARQFTAEYGYERIAADIFNVISGGLSHPLGAKALT